MFLNSTIWNIAKVGKKAFIFAWVSELVQKFMGETFRVCDPEVQAEWGWAGRAENGNKWAAVSRGWPPLWAATWSHRETPWEVEWNVFLLPIVVYIIFDAQCKMKMQGPCSKSTRLGRWNCGLVVRTPWSHCWGPGWGTKIPQGLWSSQKKKKKNCFKHWGEGVVPSKMCCAVPSRSVMSDSLRPRGL